MADDETTPDDDVVDDAEVTDALPDDLDVSGFVGPYVFPNNNRRRVPGYLYLAMAAGCVALWAAKRGDAASVVNEGLLWAAAALVAAGAYCLLSGFDLAVDEQDALVIATRTVGFPVGHASAQLAWYGLRSRPAWRILLYSADEPPSLRGLVECDAVDGRVMGEYTERNPEDWSEFADA